MKELEIQCVVLKGLCFNETANTSNTAGKLYYRFNDNGIICVLSYYVIIIM